MNELNGFNQGGDGESTLAAGALVNSNSNLINRNSSKGDGSKQATGNQPISYQSLVINS